MIHKTIPVQYLNDQRITNLYLEWLEGKMSEKSKQILHTTYKEIEKNTTALGIKW